MQSQHIDGYTGLNITIMSQILEIIVKYLQVLARNVLLCWRVLVAASKCTCNLWAVKNLTEADGVVSAPHYGKTEKQLSSVMEYDG